ncbi:hypothetical protein [Rudaeicoccus suwonensis]|uniref:Flp pilus-assembly TadE/G-like protein n=1 Tax=Rudaeicoccus suwonensis TaxID=657409 RepID=A0A561E1E8_9MICO|nr:hypothetical protein [Rudaeicoccus suwonensis]TWE09427.1 hypothetical protein BKA23_3130 [Rudaeicoccus suwonensis]
MSSRLVTGALAKLLAALRQRWHAHTAAGEEGRVILLIAGLFAILATLILGGVNLTAIQLAKVHVLDAADAAAVDAADSINEGGIYKGGLGSTLTLSDDGVQRTAAASLGRQKVPANVTGWAIGSGTGTTDGHTAQVRVDAVVRPPILSGVLATMFGEVRISVQSRARADLN